MVTQVYTLPLSKKQKKNSDTRICSEDKSTTEKNSIKYEKRIKGKNCYQKKIKGKTEILQYIPVKSVTQRE